VRNRQLLLTHTEACQLLSGILRWLALACLAAQLILDMDHHKKSLFIRFWLLGCGSIYRICSEVRL
jgi:hypothetical protein